MMVNSSLATGNMTGENTRSDTCQAAGSAHEAKKKPPVCFRTRAADLAVAAVGSALRLTVLGRRGRPLPMLGHELIELFLILGMAQTIEKIPEFGLLFLKAPQRFHAVFIEGPIAA